MSRMFSIWRPIPEFDGYFASRDGQILSTKCQPARILRPIVSRRDGHLHIFLYRDRKMHKGFIHRLVLMAWDRMPTEGEESRHLNGAPSDNRYENLVWGTRQDNSDDRVRHGRSGRGESNANHRLTEEQVIEIRQRVGQKTLRALAREYGVSHTCIRRTANGMNWGYL